MENEFHYSEIVSELHVLFCWNVNNTFSCCAVVFAVSKKNKRFCSTFLNPQKTALCISSQVCGGHDGIQRDPNSFSRTQQRSDTEAIRDK